MMYISATAVLYSKLYSFGNILIQTIRIIVYIYSIPDEELFSEKTVGCTASNIVKII